MVFLTEEQFQNKNFVNYLRTGKKFKYKDYLNYKNKEYKNQKEKVLIKLKWKAEFDACDECKKLNNKIFAEEDKPEYPHPKCKCYLVELDEDGGETESKRNPKDKPSRARISSAFGERKAPIDGASTNHKGVDFLAPKGTPIKATEGGKVIKSGAQNKNNLKEGFGYRVTLLHKWGTSTYAHMNNVPDVNVGDIVEVGQKLGEVGNTGNSSGVHLHFEIKDKLGKEIEPSKGQLEDLLNMLNND